MRKTEFKVGQDVFYPTAGVGVIEGVEELVFGAEHELCYVIAIPQNHITIRVPKEKALSNGLRPLLASQDIKGLLRVLGEKSSDQPVGHRADYYKDLERRIQSGSCLEVAAAVRDLTRLKADHGLSFEEARLLELAFGYLLREVAVVEGIALEAARNVIQSSIALGV